LLTSKPGFGRLTAASPRSSIGDGHGVDWPDVDEDISAEGMLNCNSRHPTQRQAGRGAG
jgi:hypothetical protein